MGIEHEISVSEILCFLIVKANIEKIHRSLSLISIWLSFLYLDKK